MVELQPLKMLATLRIESDTASVGSYAYAKAESYWLCISKISFDLLLTWKASSLIELFD